MKHHYPENIMRTLREIFDYDPNDTTYDENIQKLSRSEVLEYILNWEGIIGYTTFIKHLIENVYDVILEEDA